MNTTPLGSTSPIGDKYKNYTIIYILNESGGFLDSSGNPSTLNGSTAMQRSIIFDSGTLITVVHEFLHALFLQHSFTAFEANKSATYTYMPESTDNVMDYTELLVVPDPRNSLWKWQQTVAQRICDLEI